MVGNTFQSLVWLFYGGYSEYPCPHARREYSQGLWGPEYKNYLRGRLAGGHCRQIGHGRVLTYYGLWYSVKGGSS